jgi:hypothetical protein
MGPNLIYDKSFLQSISVDESAWLDAFFYSIITPLFYVETLADLEKEVREGRTPEEVVGNLALKTPDMHAYPSMHHSDILRSELMGVAKIDVATGRPIIGRGRETIVNGQRGAVFEQSLVERALGRWAQHEFLDLEREQAKTWRQGLSLIPTRDQRTMFPGWFGDQRPSDLAAVKAAADAFIDGENRRSSFSYGLSLLNVNQDAAGNVVKRWESCGSPAIAEFAPYFRHIYGVELFFYLARSADMISERRTNKVDISYLYYLPFCMVFTSNDKLHRATAPLFCRPNQSFVWGLDLKNDLSLLDQHYSGFPEEVRLRGLSYFASMPPTDTSFLVTQLWDKHMHPDWRSICEPKEIDNSDPFVKDMLEKVKKAASAPAVPHLASVSNSDELSSVVTKHLVMARRGKWRRFSPEVERQNGHHGDDSKE